MSVENKRDAHEISHGNADKTDRHVVETRLWIQILNVHRIIYAELNTALASRFGLSVPKFDVLSHLYRYPEGLAMGELSKKLRVSNGNVSGLIARLSKDGYLAKENAQSDRRSFRASLTDRGRLVFEEALEVHRNVVSKAMATQSVDQIDALTEGLKALARKGNLDLQAGDDHHEHQD